MEKTTDYKKFKFYSFNRPIDHGVVKKLYESMLNTNLLHLHPILIDKEFNIIDGQHRFTAAKMAKVPVYYIIVEDEEIPKLLSTLNTNTTNWILTDFFNMYKELHYPEYIKLNSFLNKINLSIQDAVLMFPNFASSKAIRKQFREGTYKFKTPEFREDFFDYLEDVINQLSNHANIHSKFYRRKKVFSGLSKIINHPNYNHEVFLKNIVALSMRISIKNTTKENLMFFLEIYNYRNTKHKINVDDFLKEKDDE